jgi:uncharacterized membrane protein YqjE
MSALPEQRTALQLVSDAIGQFSALVQSELKVVRAEMAEKVTEVASGAALLVVAAILIIPASVLMLMAFAAWLVELGLRSSLAHLGAGVLGLVLAGALAWIGKSKLAAENLKPKRTLHELDRDADAAKRAF